MSNESSNEKRVSAESIEALDRRLFLRSLGKWSAAAIIAAVAGGAWFASCPRAIGAGWVNRRGVGGGGWVNGGGGGGGWVNRRGGGGGGWINR